MSAWVRHGLTAESVVRKCDMRFSGRSFRNRDIGASDVFLSFQFLVLCVAASVDLTEFEKALPAKVVWAVPGMDVELPCDITPPVPSDAVNMVFWFKDTIGMPLYSWDARGGPSAEASHLAVTDDLGTRSYFITDDQPSKARLRIQHVNKEDEGVFRCRVDFINSPTRNFKVNLTLVVQPSVPRIFDAKGEKILSGTGPILEGDCLFLSCEVEGGNPRPSLTWWYNDTIIDAVVDSPKEAFTTVNQLQIASIPRSYFGARLQCRAKSLDIANDVTRDVPLILYLKPSKVKIVTPNELLSSHKTQLLRCETSGSYPPARIRWLLDGKSINANTTEEEEKTSTASILSLNVRAEDDGKELVCRAENKRFPGGFMEDRRQIHVAFPPKVAVKLDGGVAPPVEEGAELKLRCDYSARPTPYSFRWYHNGHLLPYNETGGILPTDHILVLRNISWKTEGQYSCAATNTEGETYSPPYTLNVQYSPRCRKGFESTKVAAFEHKTLVLKCHVDAVPKVTRFHWTYNTSRGVSPVKGTKMQNDGDVSTLYFIPGVADLESLSCWATNNVGRQESPCLFYIVPAKEPETPKNCALRNATHGGLEVVCSAGKDGGLEQTFVLEVNDNSIPIEQPPGVTTLSDEGEHAAPLYRVLGETPQFRLHSLQPGKEYDLVIYAVNAKGRSDPPVILPDIKVGEAIDSLEEKEAEITHDGKTPTPNPPRSIFSSQNLTLILVVLTAAVILLIVSIVVVAGVLACRRQQRPVVVMRRRQKQDDGDVDVSEAGFGEGFQRRSAQYRASLYAQELERECNRRDAGPDLILAPVSFSQQSSEY